MPASPNASKRAHKASVAVVEAVTQNAAPNIADFDMTTAKGARLYAKALDSFKNAAKEARAALRESPEVKAAREQIAALQAQIRGIVGVDGRSARGESDETVTLKGKIVDYLSNNPNRPLDDIAIACTGGDKVKANRLVGKLVEAGEVSKAGLAPKSGKGRQAILYS